MAIIVSTSRTISTSHIAPNDANEIRSRLLYKLGIYDSAFASASINQRIQDQKYQIEKREKGSKQRQPSRQQQQQRRRRRRASAICEDPQDEARSDVSSSVSPQENSVSDESSAPYSYFVPIKYGQDYVPPTYDASTFLQDFSIGLNLSASSSSSSSLPSPPSITSARKKKHIKFSDAVSVLPIPSHKTYSSHTHSLLYTSRDEMAPSVSRNITEFTYEGWNWMNAVEEDGMYALCTNMNDGVTKLIHPAHIVCSRR